MKLIDGKLILNEEELSYVKRANMNASPTIAGMFLLNMLKNHNLLESDETSTVKFYQDCVLAYRRKDFEIK